MCRPCRRWRKSWINDLGEENNMTRHRWELVMVHVLRGMWMDDQSMYCRYNDGTYNTNDNISNLGVSLIKFPTSELNLQTQIPGVRNLGCLSDSDWDT